MNADQTVAGDWNAFLENLAAELTDAAYFVALQHAVGANWLDLELDLWKAMTKSVKKPGRTHLNVLAA